MNFEFGKYTEITDLVFEISPEQKENSYIRFFICQDVTDFWYVRVLEGYNEDYEREDGCYLLERNNIPMERKHEKLTLTKVKKIIEEDAGDSWDIAQYFDLDDLIEDIDGGFGINNLREK